jgi:hypothetical protein
VNRSVARLALQTAALGRAAGSAALGDPAPSASGVPTVLTELVDRLTDHARILDAADAALGIATSDGRSPALEGAAHELVVAAARHLDVARELLARATADLASVAGRERAALDGLRRGDAVGLAR